jgi:integrase/recombinase XerD
VGKKVTCLTHPVCKQFGLHKFRHTYATTQILDGVDIVKVKNRLGHSDITTTYKYLRTIGALSGQEQVNNSRLVFAFG